MSSDAANAVTPLLTRLRVLLWNVWLLPPPLSDRIVRARARKISPLLNGYDLVILNEAFTFKQTLLSQIDYPHTILLKRKSLFDIFDSGVMILSKWPVVQTEMEHYRTRERWDRLASKGVIFVRVQLPGGRQVDVYGTHMQAGYSIAEQQSRDAQTRQLVAFILRHSGEERRVVLAGDLNMGPARNPDLQGYSVHYASPEDARLRVATYEQLKAGARLQDVISQGWEQDINRFLIRNISDVRVEYLEKPKYDDRRHLSDSETLLCTIAL
jgi:endonuclease/exonuclease/phosphatase family metal-dependent hydrolase